VESRRSDKETLCEYLSQQQLIILKRYSHKGRGEGYRRGEKKVPGKKSNRGRGEDYVDRVGEVSNVDIFVFLPE